MGFWLVSALSQLAFLFIVSPTLLFGVHPDHHNRNGNVTADQNQTFNGCDLFQGSWVYDESYPYYNSSTCPFIGEGFDCQKNGRPDQNYLKYRWQPTGCNISRFNGSDFLEKYRGKKIMLVGDSLSNNMWVSLTCMLHASVPNSIYNITSRASLSTFTLQEYGVIVIWLKNGFLVDLAYEKIGKVLKLDSISRRDLWLQADMLIFNSFHWWTHTGRQKTWDYFQVGDKIVQEMDRMEAYRIALTAWSKWIDVNIDASKIQVFYQGVAPAHYDGKEWNNKSTNKMTCRGETEPVKGSIYPSPPLQGETIAKTVIGNMKKKVYLLDVSLLSQLRKDGHPSIYTSKGSKFNDCSHWCLAGVPDTWNHLLYAALISGRRTSL